MEKREKGFSVEDLIPSEEVASGMHVPVGETMFSIPNKADDEEIEEDDMKKEALGLTSPPQSITGGEVLELPGSPQPPGMSRESGEDEETEFFGAKEDGVDFPPEHYKTQKTEKLSEGDEPDEEFFDFLFTNKDRNIVAVSFQENFIMEKHLKNLHNGLSKIGEKEKSQEVLKLATNMDLVNQSRIRLTSLVNKLFKKIDESTDKYRDKDRVVKVKDDIRNYIFNIPYFDSALIEDKVIEIIGEIESILKNSGIMQYDNYKAEPFKSLISSVANEATVFAMRGKDENLVELNDPYAKYKREPGYGVKKPEGEGGETPTGGKSATGWEGYIQRAAAGVGEKVRDAWVAYVAANSDKGYNESFGSWLSWYNSARGDKHLSPDEVLRLLKVEEVTPGQEGISGPVAKPAEREVDENGRPIEGGEMEDSPIAEEGKEPREALEEYFRALSSDLREAVVSGPARIRNARVRRKIRRLGGPAAAAEAVLSYRGGGDVEKGLALYGGYDQKQGEGVEKERAGKIVSTHRMSEFQQKAVSDLLTLDVKEKRERREKGRGEERARRRER